jgi:hypothetical protein
MMGSISTVGVALAAVTLLTTEVARAEEQLPRAGNFAVGVERLFGVTYDKMTAEQGNSKATTSETSFSLFTKPSAFPVSAPRVAFDYFVTDGLSLGAGLGYSTMSLDTKAEANVAGISGGTGTGGQGVHTFVIAPRVGYAYMFNEHVGLWPRVGVTYAWLSVDSDSSSSGSTSFDSLALSAELPLVLSPVPHVAFLLAPTIDYGVTGSVTVSRPNMPDQSVDVTPLDLGFHAGVALWF